MTVEEYLNTMQPPQYAQYQRIGKLVRSVVPDCEETITYGVLTWKYKGKYLLYFGAYKTHTSIYPVGMDMIESVKGELGDFVLTKETLSSKGTVQFSESNPVPDVLIRAIVSHRKESIDTK